MIDINGKLIDPAKVSFVSPAGVMVVDGTMQYLTEAETAHLRRILIPGELPEIGFVMPFEVMYALTDLGYAGMKRLMEEL